MINKLNLHLDPALAEAIEKGIINLGGYEKAKKVYEEITSLPIMKKAYMCPHDLEAISFLSSSEYRYNLIDKLERASRSQSSISFYSPDKVRLSIALIEKGKQDYFFYMNFIFDSEGNLYKLEYDPMLA